MNDESEAGTVELVEGPQAQEDTPPAAQAISLYPPDPPFRPRVELCEARRLGGEVVELSAVLLTTAPAATVPSVPLDAWQGRIAGAVGELPQVVSLLRTGDRVRAASEELAAAAQALEDARERLRVALVEGRDAQALEKEIDRRSADRERLRQRVQLLDNAAALALAPAVHA